MTFAFMRSHGEHQGAEAKKRTCFCSASALASATFRSGFHTGSTGSDEGLEHERTAKKIRDKTTLKAQSELVFVTDGVI